MAILRVRDKKGCVHDIRAIKGEDGAGVHWGRYIGDGTAARQIPLDADADGVLIFNQTYQTGENADGLTLRGAFVRPGEPLRVAGYTVAQLQVKEGASAVLELAKIVLDDGCTVSVNEAGTTYQYMVFLKEATA